MARNKNQRVSPIGDYHAKKQFGQNFLCDQGIIDSIISTINAHDDETIVEIGPGLAALTEPMCEHIRHLNVIEIDHDLADRLRHHPFIHDQLTIYNEDALTFDFTKLKEEGKKLRVYGNLPYNISTPLLFHLISFGTLIHDMHFMLQKEVVDRLIAQPGCSDYGKLSVMSQYHCKMMPFLEVPPQAFRPSPKVNSAVIRIVPYSQKPYIAEDESLLNRIAAAAFNQRRKTIANSMQEFLTGDDFSTLNLDPKLRAENITVKQYVEIANYVDKKVKS